MAHTYKAILRGNRIEWIDQPPQHTDPVTINVTMVEEKAAPSNSDLMADALEALANAGGIVSITDPVDWQRKQRQDRNLPGHDAGV